MRQHIRHAAARVVARAPEAACARALGAQGSSGMPTTLRRQQRFDHRLRELGRRTGEFQLATGRGITRSTARGWLGASSSAIVSLNGADRTEAELRQEVLVLQRRVAKLTALLRLALVLRPRGARPRPASGSWTDPISRDFYGPSRAPARPSRCERSCGFCSCRQAGSTPGAVASVRVRSTISGHVRALRRTA